MQPEIHLGPLTLQTFGIAFALAFLASGTLFARRLHELGKPIDWAYEGIFAALIGGLVGSRLDYGAAPIAIGYAVGRIGCQVSGDGDYGEPSDLPWAISFLNDTAPT